MNGIYQIYADAIRKMEGNADVLFNACSGLAVHTGKTKYIEVGFHRGKMINEHIRTGSMKQ